ncbi:DUF2326 domain-containing protein [Elizabethkingia meningoseptica]|uniref:DUF2326 domain-containing protein n=1 Tax=Elizabethkingia meningoseptica TaxID=238 RepID=UPI0023AFFD79|nr:DUF2326 domain-containing protein [Elizabethkingia meningoseptica]MDE5467949.1 DUF2326 domain-containing protein [Elizabethkingia meningoseptica]MDE5474868.1 DUF2326 domain-containing protein [Elizabethkingia meningoseptica]MDE5478301.1 DUF2326 domain-containing protein [Elizabethkingia meningoseptica]MDE5486700.1 DUF2326 domain-containing protein [Elizabethkingia meningoseptica]MDE5501708.1 DUF2326 domain-containing protein [Elizabethkingia meningoseptica]
MLIRIYSDTDLIDTVSFHNGINIILGKYSEDKEARGINGIGKSSLVRLIDFTLLSSKAEKRFAQKKYDFLRNEEHTLTLEFEVKGEKYFIKRSFAEPKKIYFGKHPDALDEYEKSEMPKVFEGIFFPTENNEVFFEGKRYGTLMEFFIKDDLQSQQRADPLNFVSYVANARDKALYNFYLLNLPTKTLLRYNEVSSEYEKYSNTVKSLSEKIKADTGKDVQEFRTERLKIEKDIAILEKSLKEYNFLANHKEIEQKLNQVIVEINEQSILYHNTSRKLEKLKSSYSDVSSIDLDKIQKLYNETLSTFGNFVKKSLDEVIDFKKQLLANRNKYLLEEEKKLQSSIDECLKQLEKLEKNRSQLFSLLKERGALDRIESTYERLVNEKTLLERNTSIVREIDEIEEILGNSNIVIAELKRDIVSELNKMSEYLDELRLLFQQILENAIYLDEEFDNSYFDIKLNSTSPRNQLPFKISLEIPKADALGQERLKIVAYDLMVFLKSRIDNRNIPDFLVHDGVFHAISYKTISNILNYMYHKSNELHNFQYILTFNEDEIDLSRDESKFGKFDFDWSKHIIAEYSDTEQETIFKRFF